MENGKNTTTTVRFIGTVLAIFTNIRDSANLYHFLATHKAQLVYKAANERAEWCRDAAFTDL